MHFDIACRIIELIFLVFSINQYVFKKGYIEKVWNKGKINFAETEMYDKIAILFRISIKIDQHSSLNGLSHDVLAVK